MDDQQHPGSDPTSKLSDKGEARRRFAKSGSALSGVILTMASQHGIAGTVVRGACPSGFQSVTSKSHTPTLSPLGRSPGYWKNHINSSLKVFSGTTTSINAKFGPLFGCATSHPLYNCTLYNVVAHLDVAKTNDKENVAMHLVASLLNVRAKLITSLTERKVLEIWNGYLLGGYVVTIGAKPWNGCQIVRYLKSTMDVADADIQSCGY